MKIDSENNEFGDDIILYSEDDRKIKFDIYINCLIGEKGRGFSERILCILIQFKKKKKIFLQAC